MKRFLLFIIACTLVNSCEELHRIKNLLELMEQQNGQVSKGP